MTIEIIKEAQEIVRITHEHTFKILYSTNNTLHYVFYCEEDGTLLKDTKEITRTKYEEIKSQPDKYKYLGITSRSHIYKEPRIGRCFCGAAVELDKFTCPCACGRYYNWNGQLLAPREQWGEETGEHWSDILRIP